MCFRNQKLRSFSLFFLFLCVLPLSTFADLPPAKGLSFSPSDVVIWHGEEATSYQDGYTVVKVSLETRENFGLYASKLKVYPPEGAFFSHMRGPITEMAEDPMTKEMTSVYRGGSFTFVLSNLFPHKKADYEITVEYVGCSSKICLFPYKEKVVVPNLYTPSHLPSSLGEDLNLGSSVEENPSPSKSVSAKTIEEPLLEEEDSLFSFTETSFKSKINDRESFSSFLFFLLFLLLAGVATNLTPCVYPMIPITIRILSKQETSPLLASLAYSFGIMVTYTTLALLAIASGSMFGNVSANIYVNLFLALIMFYFGLSMLGYGDYSFLQKLGYKFSPKEHGLKTAFVMGCGAGLIASPCTGPILGSLLAYSATASVNSSMILAYFVTYSFGFSLPYIFLGRAASQLSKIQFKSSIQELVKVLFSGVMFALFFYYLRIPFYSFHKTLSESWQWITLGSFAGFLGLYLISKKVELFGAVRIHSMILLGLFFFSSVQSRTQKGSHTDLLWHTQEEQGFKKAKEEGKLIFLDFWAEWCEVCKKLDKSTFSDPRFIRYMKEKEWVLLRLDLTENSPQNRAIYQKYKVIGLPTLVLLSDEKRSKEKQLRGYMTTEKLLEALESFSKSVSEKK